MSAAKNNSNIYNIPAGTAFARALAAQLIAETRATPESLATYRIILPTRRACRILREAFLQQTDGEPLLLPQMQALGDVDEEELSLALPEDMLDIPPAISPLQRQVLLARTIQKIGDLSGRDFAQSLALASALGRLMDQIYTENLDLKNLATLVPEEFANHWQVTIKFMEILSEHWPAILAESGVIDGADRRNKLLHLLADRWEQSPPQTPIIAAGTTGSIPATANLLRVIAALPQGRIVLPGLDQLMDLESWNNLDETHPQYGFHHLLQHLKILREDIAPWPGTDKPTAQNRRLLAIEIMRPAATTAEWTSLSTNKTAQQNIAAALEGLSLIPCSNEREEGDIVAILLRELLESPGKTASLITPRRSLARRVAGACRRWGIEVDDSAGETLDQTPTGAFILLSLQACAQNLAPVSLLSLLKHRFCRELRTDLPALDLALRGTRPAPGLEGLLERAPDNKTLRLIAPILERFMSGSATEKYNKFSKIVADHLAMMEALSNPETLWAGEAGEKAAGFFSQLLEQAGLFPDMDLNGYLEVLQKLLPTITVRPVHSTHPRLQILGQLEARMIDGDLIVMAGLNEKSWPPDPGHDPWMSRPMRKNFGLPSPERGIGLSAHDFVQGFCAPHVVLTRSARQDGSPTVPARWLQRLSAVLEAANIPEDKILHAPAIQWAATLDQSPDITPIRRPEPKPPLAARPRKLSVTQIEKWQQDPYSIYAKHILKLDKLDPLEKEVDAAEKGTLLHDILKTFVDTYPAQLPEDAPSILVDIAGLELEKRHDDPAVWSFWRRRFGRLADWLVNYETQWRENTRPLAREVKGAITLPTQNPFTLSARADRIDSLPGSSLGGGAVIDYKSGGTFSKTAIQNGRSPQLSLEGLILAKGGYENTPALIPQSLQYWKLTGGTNEGEITRVDGDIPAILARSESGLTAFINAFDNPATPYYSLPRPDNAPRFNDYKHLARISEWTALGDDDSSEAA